MISTYPSDRTLLLTCSIGISKPSRIGPTIHQVERQRVQRLYGKEWVVLILVLVVVNISLPCRQSIAPPPTPPPQQPAYHPPQETMNFPQQPKPCQLSVIQMPQWSCECLEQSTV